MSRSVSSMNDSLLSNPPRIAVVGTTGSGKTTLAKQIAQSLNIPHIELDALHWKPNWTEVPDEVFRGRVEQAIVADSWVTDGNYSVVRDLLWQRANIIIWLDYSFPVTFGRLLRRTLRRAITKEPVCNGNQESFRLSFFSKESILLWLFRTYNKRRQEYPVLFQQPEYAHLKIVRVRSPQEVQHWLENLTLF
jgi:adenylate kinase family enzyme